MIDLTIKLFFENFANMIFVKEMYYAKIFCTKNILLLHTHCRTRKMSH